jgi:hypothetical protein
MATQGQRWRVEGRIDFQPAPQRDQAAALSIIPLSNYRSAIFAMAGG